MSDLATLQREFQAHVLRGDGAFLAQIAQRGAPTTAAHRAFIYYNAYRRRLVEVLQNDFPGVRALTGDADFETLAAAYIDACPSRHPSLRYFGARFADFLRDFPAAMAGTGELLPAVASFFDAVMVMDEDLAVRGRRLALLAQVQQIFAPLADFTKLS